MIFLLTLLNLLLSLKIGRLACEIASKGFDKICVDHYDKIWKQPKCDFIYILLAAASQ